MIDGKVYQGEELIISTVFDDHNLSLDAAMQKMEFWLKNEAISNMGECTVKVRFRDPPKVGGEV